MLLESFRINSRRPAIRIWPILLLGFGCLVILIGLSGWLAFVRAGNTYSGISKSYQSEHEVQDTLSGIRAEISDSAILLRDFLLDPHPAGPVALAEMERQHRAAAADLTRLHDLLPEQQLPRLETLRTQTEAYWKSLAPLLNGSEKPQSLAFIQSEIVPRRQAAYALLSDISQLSFEAFLQRRHDINLRTSAFAQFLGRMVALTITIALAVAGISIYRIYTLERISNIQHSRVQAAENELRGLSRQLVGAQEEERRALSRDLHDQVGQVLTALRISIGNALLFSEDADPRIRQELELAKRLVAQALRSTRDLAMGLRPTMLDDLGLEAALEWFARQHSKVFGVPVSLEVQAPLSQLSDTQSICVYRIVQEALNNSAKYAQAKSVRIRIALVAGELEIDIADDGIGFRHGRVSSGSGLARHERTRRAAWREAVCGIEARSRHARADPTADGPDECMSASVRILVSDDHGIVRQGLRSVLSRDPTFEIVAEAADGREAVMLAESLRPHVVIMDIAMPEMSGIEATSQICKNNPDVRVIILSMHSDETYLLRALNAGAKGYLLKDSAEVDLVRAVHSVWRGKPYFSPDIAQVLLEDYLRSLQQKGLEDSYDLLTDREKEVLTVTRKR